MTTTAVSPAGPRSRKFQKGLATIEAIPLLVVFVMLVGYSVGLFGAVHSAILQSIAARTYAFETFRNRTNLTILRENQAEKVVNYSKEGIRFHGISKESAKDSEWDVTQRPLAMGYSSPNVGAKREDHLTKIFDLKPRNQSVAVGPIWIMVAYGMCLNAACGDR